MDSIEKDIYVNGIKLVCHGGTTEILSFDNETYFSPIMTIGALNITRRDIEFDIDLQELRIRKNGKTLAINERFILLDGEVVYLTGFKDVHFLKYLPIEKIVKIFNGTIKENEEDIEIDWN